MVVVTGGDKPHIGAVSIATPKTSGAGKSDGSPSPSVIAIPGHKEYQLALDASQQLARAVQSTVAVSVGIHIDDISPDLLEMVVDQFYVLIDRVDSKLSSKIEVGQE